MSLPSPLVTIDDDMVWGQPVFTGTRVLVSTLFDFIRNRQTIEDFLEEFDSVTLEYAQAVLDLAERRVTTKWDRKTA